MPMSNANVECHCISFAQVDALIQVLRQVQLSVEYVQARLEARSPKWDVEFQVLGQNEKKRSLANFGNQDSKPKGRLSSNAI